jgi:hypothetical protein
LLLVYDAQAKVDFVRFFEVRCHAHDLRKGLFGVFEGTISIVEDANAVPQLRFLSDFKVSDSIIKEKVLKMGHMPSDLGDGRELAGKRNTPLEDYPS